MTIQLIALIISLGANVIFVFLITHLLDRLEKERRIK